MKAHINKSESSNTYVGKFTSLEQLKNFTKKVNRYAVGEAVYIEDEDKLYAFDGYTWRPLEVKTDGKGLELSLFDMNEQILRQQGPIKGDQIKEAKETILNYYSADVSYYMLLNHKKSYFTVFNMADEGEFQFFDLGNAVLQCASDLGEIYSVTKTEDGQAIEIWVVDPDDTMHCLYLFNYDKGIVRVAR